MVTYCLGSARQKRAYFDEISGATVLDNVEVLFCASENGVNYFAFGDVPFCNFTVADYLKYSRAAGSISIEPSATDAAVYAKKLDAQITAFGLRPNKKLGRLSAAEMRCVTFLEKPDCEKPVVINLDGARATKRNILALRRLIAAITSDIYVCVTDGRFVSHVAPGAKIMNFGKSADGKKPRFYAARKLAKRVGAKRVAVM